MIASLLLASVLIQLGFRPNITFLNISVSFQLIQNLCKKVGFFLDLFEAPLLESIVNMKNKNIEPQPTNVIRIHKNYNNLGNILFAKI